MTTKEAIDQLQKLNPDDVLQVQMSSPNGYTFATGIVESIFFNGESPVIDTYVTDAEDSALMDSEEVA